MMQRWADYLDVIKSNMRDQGSIGQAFPIRQVAS